MLPRSALISCLVLCISALPLAGYQFHYSKPTVIDPPKTIAAGDDDRCPSSDDPCFKGNKDILGGNRTLLKVQDILTAGVYFDSDGQSNPVASGTLNDTADSKISTTSQSTFAILPGAGAVINPLRSFGQSAHLYARDRDQGNRAAAISGLLGVNSDGNRVLQISGDESASQHGEVVLGPPLSDGGYDNLVLTAAANLTGDGYDEVAMSNYNNVILFTSRDPNDASAGFQIGNTLTLPEYNGIVQTIVGLVSGNFGGKPQIAVVSIGASPYGTGGLNLTFIQADKNLSLTASSPTPIGPSDQLRSGGLVAGQFSQPGVVQLVAQYTKSSDGTQYIVPIAFDSSGVAQLGTAAQVGSGRWFLQMATGHFDPASQLDQIVAVLTTPDLSDNFELGLFSFDPSFKLQPLSEASAYGRSACFYDMKVGNFDHRDHSASAPPEGTVNLTDQVAVAYSESCGANGTYSTLIYDVLINSSNVNYKRNTIQTFNNPGSKTFIASLQLEPVDLQGRSLILGEPTIVTLNGHEQPSVIVGAPPMHVDAITPPGGSALEIINFSAAPDGFSSQFSTGSSSSTGQTTESSNTWSFASSETMEENYTLGNCELGDCASFDAKQSAKQAVDGTKSTTNGSYGKNTQNFSSTTGFGDELILRSSTITDYIYPVIGKTACPPDTPQCTDAQRQQVTVQVAGMDTVNTETLSGTGIPYYQPVWMPGNILSYPGSLNQLKAATALGNDYQELGEVITQKTDNSGDSVVNVDWAQSNSAEKSSGLSANFSFDASFSFLLKAGFDDIASGSAKASLDLSGSYGFSNLTTSTTTLDASRGLQLNRTARFADPSLYSYLLEPHIFGQQTPNTVTSSNLGTDVQTFGALRLAHVVNPISGSAGTTGTVWAEWYGSGSDVALNQPSKWTVTNKTSDPNSRSCLTLSVNTSDVDCATLSANDPGHPNDDEFRYLRGFFMQAKGGAGPQLGLANSTDQLQLSVRVHNFSLNSTPASATIHTRFYAIATDQTYAPAGSAGQLIGEQVSPTIPGFSTGDDPNWILVKQDLDLSKHPEFSDKYLFFFVLVWAQDANGALVHDLPGHGLTQLPPAAQPGSTQNYADLAALEEAYGNNLGIYHAGLFVQNPTGVGAALLGETSLEITGGAAGSQRIVRGQAALLSILVRTGNGPVTRGIKAVFYDGDPMAGAKAFAMELISFARANQTVEIRTKFRTDQPGDHSIYLVLNPGTKLSHTVKLRPISVQP